MNSLHHLRISVFLARASMLGSGLGEGTALARAAVKPQEALHISNAPPALGEHAWQRARHWEQDRVTQSHPRSASSEPGQQSCCPDLWLAAGAAVQPAWMEEPARLTCTCKHNAKAAH